MDAQWSRFLELARPKLNPIAYQRWFLPLRAVEFSPSSVVVLVPTEFFLQNFVEKYLDFLRAELSSLFGVAPVVRVELASRPLFPHPETAATAQKPAAASPPSQVTVSAPSAAAEFRRPLVSRYTFETFVVGPSNQLVHAACSNVADQPGSSYNPLFIYGGVGLGKTHLLNAIGHRVMERRPDAKIIYLHSEQFVNEVISSIRMDKMDDFHNKYRQRCDLLLIDDIQFIAGKERTQVEFFHVFNALHEAKHQIVMTSDKFPQEITELEERLRSRFQWGLIADIQPPEMELRVAILQKKAEADRIALPQEVSLFLATHVKSHVRELEGTLTRLSAFASLHRRPLTIELAREVLKDLISPRGEAVTIDQIQKVVASHYNVKVHDLKGPRRSRVISIPRQVAMYLCRKHTKASYPEIAERFGGKDHSTVVAAFQKLEKLVDADPALKTNINTIEKNFG